MILIGVALTIAVAFVAGMLIPIPLSLENIGQ